MSKLSKALKAGKKVITVEMCPPKGTDFSNFIKYSLAVKDYVTAYNVTDNQRSTMRTTPLVASKILLDNELEPIHQIACRDRNRLALQADLLGASTFGVENVLVLGGDKIEAGEYPESIPVFDLDSIQLLHTLDVLSSGMDLAGKKLTGSPTFFAGAAVNPVAKDRQKELDKMRAKIKEGAKFFQTQVVFDKGQLANFIKETKELNTKIIAGVILVKSAKMAKFLNEKVPGLVVPEWVIREMESTTIENQAQAGVKIATQLVKEFIGIAEGVHIMTIHDEFRLLDIFKEL